MDKIIFRSVFS